MKLSPSIVVAALLFAACGSSHPLAGNWSQETADDKPGMSLTFDAKDGGTKLMVHTAPREDGSHDHISGSYTFDPVTGAITVDATLLGKDLPSKWIGKLDQDHIELGAADNTLKFHKGTDPHGH